MLQDIETADLPTPVIEAHGISRTFTGPPEVTALAHADLTVRPGDYLAAVGPSGSGKSTLLNLLGLLDAPSTGTLRIAGIETTDLPERHRAALRAHKIGLVFQSFHLMPHRTALENVALAGVYAKTPRRIRREAAHRALDCVGLAHRRQALPTTMSGGERQRVAIARALINQPAMLLCDEPTGNLDSATSESIMNLFDDLCGDGLTIIVITHDPLVAARAGRTVTVRDGVLIADQPPGETLC